MRLTAKGRHLYDTDGRVVLLRGVNAGGRAKRPPFLPFPFAEAGDEAPALEEAAAEYAERARAWGCNCVRLPFTWEAVAPVPRRARGRARGRGRPRRVVDGGRRGAACALRSAGRGDDPLRPADCYWGAAVTSSAEKEAPMRDKTVIRPRLAVVSAVLIAVGCASNEPDATPDARAGNEPLPGVVGMDAGPPPPDNDNPPAQRDGRLPPECSAVAEVCDGADNDCNGEVDEVGCACTEEVRCFGGPPEARFVGECRDGVRACDANNEFFGPCEDWTGPEAEACDGLDNDCDGETDECCEGDCNDPNVPGPDPNDPCDPQTDPECPLENGGGPGEEVFVVGEDRQSRPVDFIMAVDNSGSMKDTVRQVEGNLGDFATRLAEADVDYRFVLVSERGTRERDPDVCIPPPMAGPNCANTDRFIHLDEEVGSHSAFEDILECHARCDDRDDSFSWFLRDNALLQVVVVTDDESRQDWPDFRNGMAALGLGAFVLHGVVGLRDEGCVADVGDEYIEGANETGGELLHICDNDWGMVLDVILDATVVRLQRTFVLGHAPVPDSLRVFAQRPNEAEVEQVGNWRYDAAANAVVFDDNADLPVGARIIVRYTVRN